MKRIGFVLFVVLALCAALPAWGSDPAGASEVAIAVRGGSAWSSGTEGTCIWYLPLVGKLDWRSLFSVAPTGDPSVDRQHAYLVWVSDFSVEVLEAPPSLGGIGSIFVAFAPAGEATIYYSETPESRDFSDPNHPKNLGEPVATFVRKASLLRSNDSLVTDTFIFSAELISSSTFSLNGKHFNFADLIPHGMTCFEYGEHGSSVEFATCTAVGSPDAAKPGPPAGH